MSANPRDTGHDQAVEVLPPGAVQLMQAAEIDMQIATAKKYPRSMQSFERRVRDLAMHNADIAAACTYRLSRKDRDGNEKPIVGPSARFAEVVATSYGNCRYGARVVGEDEHFVTAQGIFHDLESNAFVTFEVRRSITGKYGRYKADMIAVTANAACSIALRNAVFKGVPKALWTDLHEETKRIAKGDEKTLVKRRENMLIKFRDELGVKPEELYKHLGIKGIADIDTERLLTLGQIFTSITDGDTSADVVFRGVQDTPGDEADAELNTALGIKEGGDAPAAKKSAAPKDEPKKDDVDEDFVLGMDKGAKG